MDTIKTDNNIDKLKKLEINDIQQTPFNNFLINKKINNFPENNFGFNTPKKYQEDNSHLSITPLSIVKKMKQEISPETTNLSKINLSSKLFRLKDENSEKKPKKKDKNLHNLFYQTSEKKQMPNLKSFDILPIENSFFLKKNPFSLTNQKSPNSKIQSKKPINYFKGGCNCRNSKCLKLYCDCLRKGNACQDCNCIGCENYEGSFLRAERVKYIIKKNPNAFKPVISKDFVKDKITHSKGCNCKKSSCLKNYCECRQFGIGCGEHCRCIDCKNFGEREK